MTTTDPFAAPAAPSTGITWPDLLGALLLIEPQAIRTNVETSYGVSDVVVSAHIYVLDGPNQGAEHEDALIFPKMLVAQTQSRINEKVLGRLGQQQTNKGHTAWVLTSPTEQDKQVGINWLNQVAGNQLAPAQHTGQQAPAPTQQQQPVQQPVQQPSTVPFG